jgi:hypothetical protein
MLVAFDALQVYLHDPKRVLLFSSGKASLSRVLCSALCK